MSYETALTSGPSELDYLHDLLGVLSDIRDDLRAILDKIEAGS